MNGICGIGVNVRDYAQWLEASPRSANTIRLRLGHIEALGKRIPLYSATQYDLERILAGTRHLKPETRKAMLASWRLFYKWATRTGRIEKNPTLDMESITIPPRVPRLAPDDALQLALLSATPAQVAMITLGRFACLRLSEIAMLHTRNRHHDRLTVYGKGGKERSVYLNGDVREALLKLERDQGAGYYFPGRYGSHMHPQSVNKIITRITGCNPHSLRHAGATAAYKATRDLRSVQAMLGHASLKTTERYLHLDDDALRMVAEGTRFTSTLATVAA